MRKPVFILAAALICLASTVLTASAESTKTVKLELSPTAAFAVENLAGTMRVVAGTGSQVVAVATIHAEDDRVMGMSGFEQVTGESGRPTLRVIYPIDDYATFRYPRNDSGSWLGRMFGGSSTTTKYAGRKVKVSESSGVLLYADVEVQLPRRSVEGSFRNVVGHIEGRGVEGTLTFDTGSGNVTLEDLRGTLTADTGSGDIKALDLEGSFSGDTGSGNIELTDFEGEKTSCETGSGDIFIKSAEAARIDADTGSGDITISESEVEVLLADTGSGDILLEAGGARLAEVSADTGSGDVTLRLGPDASFEAMARLGSGDIENRYSDAEPIVRNKEVVGYRRGGAKTRIKVDTGSGDLLLEPGS